MSVSVWRSLAQIKFWKAFTASCHRISFFQVEWIFRKPSRHLWYILTSPLLKSIIKSKLTFLMHIPSFILHDSSVQFYSKEKVFVLCFFLTFSKITFLLYPISSPWLNTYIHIFSFSILFHISVILVLLMYCYCIVFWISFNLEFFSFHFSEHGLKIKK